MTDDQNIANKSPDRTRGWRHFDVASGIAFIVGGVMSLGGIINNIQNKFYNAHVLGYGETPTMFTPLVEEYLGDHHLGKANTRGKFVAYHRQLEAIDKNTALKPEERIEQAKKVMGEMRTTSKEFRTLVENKMRDTLGIRSDGIHRWTDGAWKKFRNLGVTASREAALGIAATSAVGIGAIFLLRSQNRSLNDIEDKIDTLSEKGGRS